MAHASLLVWDESQNVLILGQYLKKVLKTWSNSQKINDFHGYFDGGPGCH